jgi:hypothetical protein
VASDVENNKISFEQIFAVMVNNQRVQGGSVSVHIEGASAKWRSGGLPKPAACERTESVDQKF